MATTKHLRILTFNTWGMPLASKDVHLRLQKQADFFRQSGKDLDIVLLQEVWTEEFVALLSAAAADAGLVHHTTFDGGVLGAGLVVLSRHPIVDVAFRGFSVRGEPGALQGEALSGKGIGYARVRLPSGAHAHLFNTHTHANWVHSVQPDDRLPDVKIPTDTFGPYRTANILDAVAFMRPIVEAAATAGEVVFAGGDWNVPVDNLEACLLLELLPALRDAWQAAGHPPLDPAGNTCGDSSNVYTGSIIGGYVPERIDYIWTNSRVVACETTLKQMPGSELNYSDHFAVLLTAEATVDQTTFTAAGRGVLVVEASAVAEAAVGTVEGGSDTTGGIGLRGPTGGEAGSGRCGVQQRRTHRTGPVAEARISPEPSGESQQGRDDTDGDDDGGDEGSRRKEAKGGGKGLGGRRSHLLGLALQQLAGGLAAATAQEKRLRRLAACWIVVVLVLLAVQMYGIMAETDHWGKRLAAGTAAVAAVGAVAGGLYVGLLLMMIKSGRRGLGQLVRMAEVWRQEALRLEGAEG